MNASGEDPRFSRMRRDGTPARARAVAAGWRPDPSGKQALRGRAGFPEIDCIRRSLPPGVAAAAERRAEALGVGADEVLIAAGHITAEGYCRALAASLDVRFVDLDAVARPCCPISSALLVQAAAGGLLPLRLGDTTEWIMAPRGASARQLVRQAAADETLTQPLHLTTPENLRRFILRHEAAAIGWLAADWLRRMRPLQSAAARNLLPLAGAAAAGAGFALAAVLAPGPAVLTAQLLIAAVFLAWAGMRLSLLLAGRAAAPAPMADDRSLPGYTVVAALYREAAALPELVEVLRGLDYPPEKLTVLLVLEPDDIETRRVLDALVLPSHFETILAPLSGPRTKPKALNAALPFARGDLLVVFDAESRPEADQLRQAAAAFAADAGGRLGCVQGRLTIDNTDDGWLAALFTAEYAGLFDVMLPGLAACRLPIPLGGSSNHFRLGVLREAGGWDPHNVTEDADLGARLARLGYRTGVLASSTYEEAPARVAPWLRQRTRWFKGWMQTWCVHMRRPMRLLRELGLRGFLAFQLLCIGTVAAALLQPLAWALLAAGLAMDGRASGAAPAWPGLDFLLAVSLVSGYAVSVVLAAVGLAQRRLGRIGWLLVLMPVYWLMLSVAAWRAAFQLLYDPYRWEKTEHGLGRSSRRAGHRA